MIHVYYGEGKGKTTAAIGLAIRAAGAGMKVCIVRFMKTDNSGEVKVINGIENITLKPCNRSFGFIFNMTEEQKKQAKVYYTELLRETITDENVLKYDMIVMDEANIVFYYDLIEKSELLNFLKKYGNRKEIVLTGASKNKEVIELGDYVTELKKHKHPFDKGIDARMGIEY